MTKNKFIICLSALIIVSTGKNIYAQSNTDYKKDIKSYQASKKLSSDNKKTLIDVKKSLELGDVLQYTMTNNPELKSFAWNIRSKKALTVQDYLWDNPEIEFGLENIGAENVGLEKFSIGFKQLIDLGAKRAANVSQSKKEEDLALLEYEIKRLELLVNAAKQFLEVLKCQVKLKYLEKSLESANDFYEFVQTKQKAGSGSVIESSQAQKELALKQQEKTDEENNYKLQKKILSSFWGDRHARFENVSGKLTLPENIPQIGQILEKTDKSPELKKWLIIYEMQKNEKKKNIAKLVPDLSLSFTYERNFAANQNTFNLGGSFVLPLINFNNGFIDEANYNIRKLEHEKELIESQLENILSEKYLKMKSAFSKASLLNNSLLKLLNDSYNEGMRFYQLGKISTVELLVYKNELLNSEIEQIELLTEFYQNKLDMEFLLGSEILLENKENNK